MKNNDLNISDKEQKTATPINLEDFLNSPTDDSAFPSPPIGDISKYAEDPNIPLKAYTNNDAYDVLQVKPSLLDVVGETIKNAATEPIFKFPDDTRRTLREHDTEFYTMKEANEKLKPYGITVDKNMGKTELDYLIADRRRNYLLHKNLNQYMDTGTPRKAAQALLFGTSLVGGFANPQNLPLLLIPQVRFLEFGGETVLGKVVSGAAKTAAINTGIAAATIPLDYASSKDMYYKYTFSDALQGLGQAAAVGGVFGAIGSIPQAKKAYNFNKVWGHLDETGKAKAMKIMTDIKDMTDTLQGREGDTAVSNIYDSLDNIELAKVIDEKRKELIELHDGNVSKELASKKQKVAKEAEVSGADKILDSVASDDIKTTATAQAINMITNKFRLNVGHILGIDDNTCLTSLAKSEIVPENIEVKQIANGKYQAAMKNETGILSKSIIIAKSEEVAKKELLDIYDITINNNTELKNRYVQKLKTKQKVYQTLLDNIANKKSKWKISSYLLLDKLLGKNKLGKVYSDFSELANLLSDTSTVKNLLSPNDIIQKQKIFNAKLVIKEKLEKYLKAKAFENSNTLEDDLVNIQSKIDAVEAKERLAPTSVDELQKDIASLKGGRYPNGHAYDYSFVDYKLPELEDHPEEVQFNKSEVAKKNVARRQVNSSLEISLKQKESLAEGNLDSFPDQKSSMFQDLTELLNKNKGALDAFPDMLIDVLDQINSKEVMNTLESLKLQGSKEPIFKLIGNLIKQVCDKRGLPRGVSAKLSRALMAKIKDTKQLFSAMAEQAKVKSKLVKFIDAQISLIDKDLAAGEQASSGVPLADLKLNLPKDIEHYYEGWKQSEDAIGLGKGIPAKAYKLIKEIGDYKEAKKAFLNSLTDTEIQRFKEDIQPMNVFDEAWKTLAEENKIKSKVPSEEKVQGNNTAGLITKTKLEMIKESLAGNERGIPFNFVSEPIVNALNEIEQDLLLDRTRLLIEANMRHDMFVEGTTKFNHRFAEYMESTLSNSVFNFKGARYNAENISRLYGGQVAKIEGKLKLANLFNYYKDPANSRAIKEALIKLRDSKGDLSTQDLNKNDPAFMVANIIQNRFDNIRALFNAAGGNRSDMGSLTRLNHRKLLSAVDIIKEGKPNLLTKAARTFNLGAENSLMNSNISALVQYLFPKLDKVKTFEHIGVYSEKRQLQTLRKIVTNMLQTTIKTNEDFHTNTLKGLDDFAERLFFTSAKDEVDVLDKFGYDDLEQQLYNDFRSIYRTYGLLTALGPNPYRMLTNLRELFNAYNAKTKNMAYDVTDKHMKNIKHTMALVDGSAMVPGSGILATLMRTLRVVNTLVLGKVAIRGGLEDYANSVNLYATRGLAANGMDGTKIFANAIGLAGTKEGTALARALGIFQHSVGAEMTHITNLDYELGGTMNWLQQGYYKWSGIEPLANLYQKAMALSHSSLLADSAGISFDKLNKNLKDSLLRYEIANTAKEKYGAALSDWDIIRAVGVISEKDFADSIGTKALKEDRSYMTPERILSVDNEKLGKLIGIENPKHLKAIKKDLAEKLNLMITDATYEAITIPTAKVQRWVTGGQRPGTVSGEVARTALQFKSFPFAMFFHNYGRNLLMKMDVNDSRRVLSYLFQEGFSKDSYMKDFIPYLLTYLVITDVGDSLIDLLEGKTPVSPTSPRFYLRTLRDSSIFPVGGDAIAALLDNTDYQSDKTVEGNLTGPTISRTLSNIRTITNPMRSTKATPKEKVQRTAAAIAYTTADTVLPANMWYLDLGLKILILDRLKYYANPDSFTRQTRRFGKKTGQEYLPFYKRSRQSLEQ